jgi:L,D-transpeptidase YbiS
VRRAAIAFPVLALVWLVRCLVPGFQAWTPHAPPATAEAVAALTADETRLRAALAAKQPRGRYIVIDTANNRLWVRDGQREVLQAVCSTGSRIRLVESATGRSWEFQTPRGAFHVREKLVEPLWRMPDWAFIEENQPLPPDPGARFQSGALGAYALDIGSGYFIHGTLYERLLGRSVTHGCVRLGREDLERVYDACPVGTPVYVF